MTLYALQIFGRKGSKDYVAHFASLFVHVVTGAVLRCKTLREVVSKYSRWCATRMNQPLCCTLEDDDTFTSDEGCAGRADQRLSINTSRCAPKRDGCRLLVAQGWMALTPRFFKRQRSCRSTWTCEAGAGSWTAQRFLFEKCFEGKRLHG